MGAINNIATQAISKAVADEIFKANPFMEWLRRDPFRDIRRIARDLGYTCGSNFEKM